DDSLALISQDERLRLSLEEAFEEEMGEVLDMLFTDLDKKIAKVGGDIGDLIGKMDAGTLDKRDMLELRLIQITNALFTSLVEAVPAAEGEDIFQQLMNRLKELKLEAPARRRIGVDVMTGEAPDLSAVPEEFREEVRKQIQEAREAAQKAAGDLPGGPGAPRARAAPRAPSGGPPPEVLKRIQEEEKKAREEAIKRAEGAGQ
ncbi:MAG: hypothetical protein KAX44_01775, partial [Candidatus Brocadiae bacterium]|nr:hypothetical protein [Candidatus Brocadiia bacterium]